MDPVETQNPPHIGEQLRLARERDGLTHGHVAEHLRIQPAYLEAIEKLDKAALPSIGYVLGYVRAYAHYMGMDGKEAVEAYKVDSEVPENLGMRDSPHFVPKRHIRLPRGFFPATTVMACAAVLAFWYGSQSEARSAALSAITPPPSTDTGVPEAVVADPDIFTIKAKAPSWVQIKDKNGDVIISRILIAGESWQANIDSGISLSARDSGALELYVGGELMGDLGSKGVPMIDVPMPAVPRSSVEALERLKLEEAAKLEAAQSETGPQDTGPQDTGETSTEAPSPDPAPQTPPANTPPG